MSAPLLELSEVTTSLRISRALQPVIQELSFTVHRSEILGLVGESGSGKSMTARTIMGLLPPGAQRWGGIALDGEELPRKSRALRPFLGRKVAIIFQDPRAHIDPLYRNGDHIIEGLRAHQGLSRSAASEEALKLLSSVGIADPQRVLTAYPWQISGGMLQRVLIAGALTGAPELLIADEATTALDVTTQVEIVALLSLLRSERKNGIIFITHDLDLAAAICDRVIVMYAGRIMEQQETLRLFDSPLHPYTAALLKARPRIDARPAGLQVIPGQSVSAYESPPGCPFRPRCAFAIEACATYVPELRPAGDGGLTSCLRADQIGPELRTGGDSE